MTKKDIKIILQDNGLKSLIDGLKDCLGNDDFDQNHIKEMLSAYKNLQKWLKQKIKGAK